MTSVVPRGAGSYIPGGTGGYKPGGAGGYKPGGAVSHFIRYQVFSSDIKSFHLIYKYLVLTFYNTIKMLKDIFCHFLPFSVIGYNLMTSNVKL
jgi:hypothetical protein